MKVAMYNLTKGVDVPVIALVHALDSEARIGDRPNYEEFKAELFQIKEKINQGEELRKKIKDMGMSAEEKAILDTLYDDISNEISKVLTAFERRACEVLATGKLVVDENNAKFTVDYQLASTNKKDFSDWGTPDHDIIADLIALKEASKDKIVRQIVSSKVLGYMLANTKLNAIAEKLGVYVTRAWVVDYIQNVTGIELIVDDRTYRTSYLTKEGKANTKEYRFFPEDVVISLTTRGEVGNTFMTSTTIEDANMGSTYGFVAVDQWVTKDPHTSWTMAEGIGLPVIRDINNTLYLSKITA